MTLRDERKNLFLTFPLYPFLPFPQITAQKPPTMSTPTPLKRKRETKGKEPKIQSSVGGGAAQ